MIIWYSEVLSLSLCYFHDCAWQFSTCLCVLAKAFNKIWISIQNQHHIHILDRTDSQAQISRADRSVSTCNITQLLFWYKKLSPLIASQCFLHTFKWRISGEEQSGNTCSLFMVIIIIIIAQVANENQVFSLVVMNQRTKPTPFSVKYYSSWCYSTNLDTLNTWWHSFMCSLCCFSCISVTKSYLYVFHFKLSLTFSEKYIYALFLKDLPFLF